MFPPHLGVQVPITTVRWGVKYFIRSQLQGRVRDLNCFGSIPVVLGALSHRLPVAYSRNQTNRIRSLKPLANLVEAVCL